MTRPKDFSDLNIAEMIEEALKKTRRRTRPG